MTGKIELIAALLFGSVAHASGYQVSNYVGTIGEYPIHVSIQSLEKVGGYGRGVQCFGSYYYDRHRTPISLYGRQEGGVLRLCEELNQDKFKQEVLDGKREIDVSSCPFRLSLDGDGLSGKWNNGKSAYRVSLKRVAGLDGPGADVVDRPRESTADIYMHIGTCHLQPAQEVGKSVAYVGADDPLNPRLIGHAFFFGDIEEQSKLSLEKAAVRVVGYPLHGKLSGPNSVEGVDQLYFYRPNVGYAGDDKVVFVLTGRDGVKVKVGFFVKVNSKYNQRLHPKVDKYLKYCPNPSTWKIYPHGKSRNP